MTTPATAPGVPAKAYQPAEVSLPLLETTCGSVLRDAAARYPEVPALVEGVPDPAARRRWTYAGLLDDAERAARALLLRFDPGERVAVWAPNLPEWILLQFGAALAGLTLVTVNPLYRAAEAGDVLRRSGAAGVFLVPQVRGNSLAAFLDQVRPSLPGLRETVLFTDWADFARSGPATQSLPDVAPGDPAQIQYTSGTTGRPKGAVIHHRGYTNNARFIIDLIQLQPGEAGVNPMPLFHSAGSGCMTLSFIQGGGTQVLMPAFDPALFLALQESERGRVFGGVPTMLLAALEHPDFTRRDLSAIRIAWSGGALVPPGLVRRVEAALGVPFVIVYAQTEASPVITATRSADTADDRAETAGRAFPHTEVRIADPADGATLPRGTIGEICTRGYHVMTGYLDDPDATTAAIDAGGWLHTGDLGAMDERGYCTVTGRVKEMIIRGGENIYPREIEHVLSGHPSVADVAVVGVPDPHWGEQVAAFIRLAAGAPPAGGELADELTGYCAERLARYKVPRYWEFVDAFPLTPSGKVQKFALREQFAGRRAQRATGSAAGQPGHG